MVDPTILSRPPMAALRPFIDVFWASAGAPSPLPEAPRLERMLPTGTMHVVLRLSDAPVRIRGAAPDGDWDELRHGIVGGARSTFHLRDPVAHGAAVGALLRPGGARLLLPHAGADELAQRHVALADVIGPAATMLLRERLADEPGAAARITLLEAFFAARLPLVKGMHPAVAELLAALERAAPVGAAVAASGLSHRHVIAHFRRAVGLAPKAFQRVCRFQGVIRAMQASPRAPLADVALAGGYSDQSHFQREFAAITGITPGEYRRLAPVLPNHLPLSPGNQGQFRARRR